MAASRTAGRRLSVVTLDQLVAGGSNFLALLAAAHLLPVADFGRFGITLLVYGVALGVSRALVSEPSLVHPEEVEAAPGRVLASGYAVGVGLGSVLLLVGAAVSLLDGGLGRALVVLGLCFPLLVAQDLGRFLGIGRHRPGDALRLDLVWLVLAVVGVALLATLADPTVVAFVLVWAGAGAVAGLLTPWQHRREAGQGTRPDLDWLRGSWPLAWRYLATNLVNQGAALGASVLVLAVLGAHALGAVQGAQLLTRPFSVLLAAASAAGISELARSAPGQPAFARTVRLTTGLVTVAALATVTVMVLLPDPLGRAFLGGTWEVAEALLLPAGLQLVPLGLLTGARIGLYGTRRMDVVLRLDLVGTGLLLTGLAVGLRLDGAHGALWGLVIAQGAVAVLTLVVAARVRPRSAGRHVATGPEVVQWS